MESFVANPKYHIDDFLSGSRFFVCGKKGTGKSALLKYLECHFLKDESNLVFPIRFKSEIEQVDKDSFEEIASAPDNSTKNEKYDTSSILDQSSYGSAIRNRQMPLCVNSSVQSIRNTTAKNTPWQSFSPARKICMSRPISSCSTIETVRQSWKRNSRHR